MNNDHFHLIRCLTNRDPQYRCFYHNYHDHVRLIHFDDKETLKSSYELLRNCSISLFKIVYPLIRKGIDKDKLKINNINIGKTNFKSDFDNVFEILPKGWDTEISFVRSLSKQKKLIRRND